MKALLITTVVIAAMFVGMLYLAAALSTNPTGHSGESQQQEAVGAFER